MAKDITPGKASDLNDVEIHNFSKGWSVDLDNHAEKPESYSDAWNGRLYSKNGTLAFTSINGERFAYQNNDVLQFNGHYAFQDVLIVFAKGNFSVPIQETETQIICQISVNNFNVNSTTNEINGIDFSGNFTESNVEVEVPVNVINENDFKQSLSDIEETQTISSTYNGLFTPLIYNPLSPVVCSFGSGIPENNSETVKDGIFSFVQNSDGTLTGTLIYSGYLNIPLNAIITTEGVNENLNYKRVYFSDYYNPTRVVNIKDKSLINRNPKEFDIKTKGKLLSPRIKSVETNGQLRAMTVFYVMKLITENGQVSDFSPLSKGVKITKKIGAVLIGGDVSEVTNKSVVIDCYIPDQKNFKEVQLIAIEFEAKDVPTAIRLVGTKAVNNIVTFEHFGSESEYVKNITIADLFANSISWRYNSDFTTKNNKLIVSGLRNDPSYLNSKNLALDFSIKSFNAAGETYACLLNPNPIEYNLINALENESFFYVKRKLYREIQVFGNFKMKLINKLQPNDFFEYIESKVLYDYINQTSAVANFLLETKENITFESIFPNLNIKIVDTKILFEPINPLIPTDFSNYNLEFSTSQVIVDLENDIENKTISWPTTELDKENKLVYGGVSNGWFNGNGVKITMHSVFENVLSKNNSWMEGSTLPLNIIEPNMRKCVMKGEIYRLGIQWFKNGNRLFTTILGDIKIPDIGQKKRELDINGNVIINSDTYKNWSIIGNDMLAEKIELQFDVRINCELSKEVDSYQIVYVERNENNRTILAQGISAPLERMSDFMTPEEDIRPFDERLVQKWMLPSNGGPVYDSQGLLNYDINPETNVINDNLKTIVTSRKDFYFDSPDFVHNKISTNFVESSFLEYIETIATDHDRHNIMGGYDINTCGWDAGGDENPNERGNPGCQGYSINGTSTIFSPDLPGSNVKLSFENTKFSQKIPSNLLSGNEKTRPFWVNTSVFANRLKTRIYGSFQNKLSEEYKYLINKSAEVNPGEILSGYKLNDSFEYANHALSLGNPGWFYGASARSKNKEYCTFNISNIAGGRKSVFIKTQENFFTTANIAQTPYIIKSKVNFGSIDYRNNDELKGNDAYIVSNLKRNNQDSIYGGRTDFAYSSNEYIPLSEVIPVDSQKIISQIFYVEGDSYCSLYLRNKTSYENTEKPELIRLFWRNFNGADKYHRRFQYNKYNAWCYAVVLESTIEPKLTNSEEFYLFSKSIDFNYEELYNSAYLQENNLKKSIPVPYNFKDDPILNNIIAVSKTKLNGDSIDAWTEFSTNEFYELDKNMGSVLNLVKEKDQLFAIQALQTSKILMDERSFVTPDNNGTAIQIGQGNGTSISGHEVVSDYGTGLRRAVIETPFGFVFYDEIKNEYVKITEPLFAMNMLSLEIRKMLLNDTVIGAEGYYDDEFKETNIRLRTKNGLGFVISYNELLKVFNGKIDFNNDLYFRFQNKIFSPYFNSKKIGELNRGQQLNFFGVQKNIKLKVISAPQFFDTKINKGIAVYCNTNYPLLKTTFITSLGHSRIIEGTHHWYKIREGVHTLPAKNATDYDDIRGEWCSIEIESESKNNQEVKFFSLINFFRKSYK